MKNILIIIGTRPEAIKFYPLIRTLKKVKKFKVKICVTSQHKDLLKQMLEIFKIKIDYDLKIMKSNQSLIDIYSNLPTKLKKIYLTSRPDIVLVQGDTISAMIAAQVADFMKIPVGHIEAGLRTYDKYSPWPEELCRQIISKHSSINFCPTKLNLKNLRNEKIKNNFLTGNTIIDAVQIIQKEIFRKKFQEKFHQKFKKFLSYKNKIYFTLHRRENFGKPAQKIFSTIKKLSSKDTAIIYPVHPNPNIKRNAYINFRKKNNIFLTKPLNYFENLYLIYRSNLILSDSGGIQEESSALSKPILVLRDKTERIEIIGRNAYLVGSNQKKIIKLTKFFLKKKKFKFNSPYGNGKASKKISNILKRFLNEK